MSKMKTTINKDTNEMTMTRSFNAPRNLVWKAYTDKELIAKWWGPRIFNTVVKEMDVRPGGAWWYVMIGTEGEWKDVEAGGKAFYEKVEEPSLLVYKDVFVDKEGNAIPGMPEAMVTINFDEKDGVTTITSVTKYANLQELEKVAEMGVEEGMGETLDRLEELLETM